MKSFTLEVITQEQHLLTETITTLTVPTESGEITILADHQPLFTKLSSGEMTYEAGGKKYFFAITGGFIDVSPRNIATILADSAIRSDKINLEEIEKAIENAKKALELSPDQQTTLKIEAELRSAILMSKIATKHKQSTH